VLVVRGEGQERWCRNNVERRPKGRSGGTEDVIKSSEYKDLMSRSLIVCTIRREIRRREGICTTSREVRLREGLSRSFILCTTGREISGRKG